jgi:hypothetical protein
VRRNRSIPSASVIPVLVYPDVREAVRFLEDAFGFVERVQIGEDHRAQLSYANRRAPALRRTRRWFAWTTRAPTASTPAPTAR